MQYLNGVYKTVSQQAVMTALNRDEWGMGTAFHRKQVRSAIAPNLSLT
jgi:hypothetical protein